MKFTEQTFMAAGMVSMAAVRVLIARGVITTGDLEAELDRMAGDPETGSSLGDLLPHAKEVLRDMSA